MWLVLANLPKSPAEVQNRIVELEARVKTRALRPEPDLPDLDQMPSPTALQTVRAGSSCFVYCTFLRD